MPSALRQEGESRAWWRPRHGGTTPCAPRGWCRGVPEARRRNDAARNTGPPASARRPPCRDRSQTAGSRCRPEGTGSGSQGLGRSAHDQRAGERTGGMEEDEIEEPRPGARARGDDFRPRRVTKYYRQLRHLPPHEARHLDPGEGAPSGLVRSDLRLVSMRNTSSVGGSESKAARKAGKPRGEDGVVFEDPSIGRIRRRGAPTWPGWLEVQLRAAGLSPNRAAGHRRQLASSGGARSPSVTASIRVAVSPSLSNCASP